MLLGEHLHYKKALKEGSRLILFCRKRQYLYISSLIIKDEGRRLETKPKFETKSIKKRHIRPFLRKKLRIG